ncbi:MAG TPA: cache domain-containing protein, partial [Negativicutes bacterium]|nr:cache domain-containing protein [Negativicutes bacterium]
MMIFKKKPADRYIIILTVLFGLVLLCAIWIGLYYKIQSEQQQELEAARKETANYARMFEEHTIRTLRGLDEITIYIKHQAEEHGLNVDLVKLTKERMLEGQPFSSLGIIDENGDLIASGRGSLPNVNIRDREAFRVHKDVDSNKLYVGMPLVGRVSGQVSIHMSRRINKPDGSFGGIIFIGIDPNYFGEFYKQIDLGANSVIALIGRDGIARVRQSGTEVQVGADFSDYPEVMNTLAGSGSG